MNQAIKTFIYPVKDIAQAKALYSRLLGVAPTMDQPYYVHFVVGDQEIGLDPHGHAKGMTGPVGYLDVSDIKQTVQMILDAGGQVQQEAQDVGAGLLVALVKDADGNMIGLKQAP